MSDTAIDSERRLLGPKARWGVLAALGVVAIGLGSDVVRGQSGWLDAPLIRGAKALRAPVLTACLRPVTDLGDGWVLAVFAAATALVLLRVGERRAARFVALSSIGAALSSTLIKLAIARPRPVALAHLVAAGGFSFPSGHSMASAAIYGALAMVVGWRFPKLAIFALLSAAALVVAIGFSRVYLGVHYPSDVLAGWALGSCWPLWLRPMLSLSRSAATTP